MSGARWAIQAAQQVGYHAAQIDELERMLWVMEHDIARVRPQAAWELLPLGWDAEATLLYLKALAPEDEIDHELYEKRLGALRARMEDAEALHREYLAIQTNKDDVSHVH